MQKNGASQLSPLHGTPEKKKKKLESTKAKAPSQHPPRREDSEESFSSDSSMDTSQSHVEKTSGVSGETEVTPAQVENTQATSPPSSVIIKLCDGKGNFFQTTPADLNKIANVIRAAVDGVTLQSRKLPGGDLMVYPETPEQQKKLLALTQGAGRLMKSSLPRSAQFPSGVIKKVPLDISDEDIFSALQDQRVTETRRFLRPSGINYLPTGTVKLTFNGARPPNIQLNEESYQVEIFIPKAYLCLKCGGLYHTQSNCPNAARCINCGSSAHVNSTTCPMKCVNCQATDHNASNKKCPAYSEAQKAVELNKREGISFQEAQQRIRAQSAVDPQTDRPYVSNAWAHPMAPSDLDALKRDLDELKQEVQLIREVQVPTAHRVAEEAKACAEAADTKVDRLQDQLDMRLEGFKAAHDEFANNLIETLATTSAQQTSDILTLLNERLPPPVHNTRNSSKAASPAAASNMTKAPSVEQLRQQFTTNFARVKLNNRPPSASPPTQADRGGPNNK